MNTIQIQIQIILQYIYIFFFPLSYEQSFPCRMTAVCPSDSGREGVGAGAVAGAAAGAGAAASRGAGPPAATGSLSVSGGESGESTADSVRGSNGDSAVVAGVHRHSRWSRQDSSDINTDDEGACIRRLTPLERLNLDMCQDERYGFRHPLVSCYWHCCQKGEKVVRCDAIAGSSVS